MSEVTKGGGSHYDGCHESMDAVNARSQSEGIMSDLKYMQPTAWIAWLVADSEYECLQTDSNWGLLHAVFEKDGPVPDYHTNLVNGDGSKKDWVPGEGYWAVTKQFYTMMQYSKYLKAGYQMVEIGDGNMCAAISPAGDELVIVAQNFGGDRDTSLDLYHVPGAAQALVYRTSDTESCELVETQDVTRGILDMTLPHNSVTTYVVRPSQGQTLCDMENYRKTVDADVVKPEESWTKETDKFTYLGDWGESAEEYGGGKYSTAEEASVTFTFSGTRAAVYGTAAPEGTQAEILVDGELTESVSLAADQKDGSRMLCDTGVLSEGIHTVTIRKAEGQGDRLLEINCAKVITGEFAEEITSVDPCPVVFTASQVRPDLPGQVTVRTNRGNEALRDVQWELDGIDFTRDVTVYGSVEGTTCKASAEVRIAGENIQYFIDCNNPQSSTYAEIDQYAGLLNRVPDQPYADGTWGYLEDYGVYDGDPKDSYDIGWYAFGGQEIAYKVPLKTGTYEVSFGFKEWWPSSCSSRPMSITAETGGDETVLGTSDTWEDGNNWNKDVYTVTCQEEGDVVFRVKKGGGFDPVLSFIQIRHVLELQGLKDALAEAAGIDRSLYDPRQLEQLDETVQEGRALLVGSETTQGQADQTAEEILAIVREPDVNPGVDLKSLQLAAAMAGKLEQEQKENHCFTEESWKAVEESLDRARTILESGSTEISQGEADRVFLDLITACSLLENGVQKVGLKAAIEGARAILADTESLAQYRTESVEAVQKALEAAEQVYNSGISDQETVNRATTELLTAVTSLLVDEEAARLEILIQKAEELLAREEQYTPSTVRKLKEMLEAAKRTAGDSQSTAEQNKEAYDNLAGAMTSLVRKGSKEELKNALEKAGEILADSGRYLEDSIAGLAAVRDEAQAVYDDQEAGGDVIGEVLQKLVREILKARLLGDVDLNGVVDTGDSQILLRVSAELGTLTEEQSQAADVNRDGLADSMDASAILKYASEITDIIR